MMFSHLVKHENQSRNLLHYMLYLYIISFICIGCILSTQQYRRDLKLTYKESCYVLGMSVCFVLSTYYFFFCTGISRGTESSLCDHHCQQQTRESSWFSRCSLVLFCIGKPWLVCCWLSSDCVSWFTLNVQRSLQCNHRWLVVYLLSFFFFFGRYIISCAQQIMSSPLLQSGPVI